MQYYSSQGKPLDLTLGSLINIQGNGNSRDIRVARLAGRFVVAHMKRPGCWIDCRRVPNSRCINAKREDGSLVVVGYWEEYAKSKVYPLPRMYHTVEGFSCVTVRASKKRTVYNSNGDRTLEVGLTNGKNGDENYVIRLLSQRSLEEMKRLIEESGGNITDGIDKSNKLYDDAGNYVGYLMRCYYMDDEKGGGSLKRIIASQFVNSGGEGTIYQLDGASEFTESHQYVVKIYNNPDKINVDKLKRLKEIFEQNRECRSRICYPRFMVYDKPKGGKCVGMLMLECESSDTLYNIVGSIQNLRNRNWTRNELVTMAIDILERFEAIHRMGLLMGDVNLNNILVAVDRVNRMPMSVIIDVDSFQIGDEERFLCPVFRHEFLSPRLQMQGEQSNFLRTLNDEYYAIAVLIFNILFLGRHPYETSRPQCLENQIKARDFLFPQGYDQHNDVLRGAYLRIWRSLSEGLRKAFYDTFHQADSSREFMSPREWIPLLEEYREQMRNNSLPRTIYPRNKDILDSYLPKFEYDGRNFAGNAQYGCYLNELAKSEDGDNCAIIELGATWMSLFTPNGRGSDEMQELLRNYIYCIKPDGTLDIEKFVKNTDRYWQEFKGSVVGLRPRITKLYIYSGSFLRNIKNRDEVIATIKERWGLNIGVLSVAKEADMLFGTQGGKGKKGAMAVNIGYTSTLLAVWYEEKKTPTIMELGNLGLTVLRNCIFGTSAVGVTRTDLQFAQIDKEIEDRLQRVKFHAIKRAFVVVKGRKISGKSLSYGAIEEEFEALTKDLLTNRTYVSALYNDVESPMTQLFKASAFSKLGRRLELSIYLALMRKFGLKSLDELVGVYEGMTDDVVNIK